MNLSNKVVIYFFLIKILAYAQPIAALESVGTPLLSGAIRESTLKDEYLIQTGNMANLRFTKDPENSSKKVLEITLNRSDPDAANSHRTELLGRKDAMGNEVEMRWYGFDFYIPKDWKYDPLPIVVAQLHGNDRLILAPPLSLQIQGGRMFLMLQSNINKISSKTPPTTGNSVRTYPWHSPLTIGRWYRLIVRAYWSAKPGVGELDVWMNGDLIVTQRGTPNTYETSEGIGGRNYAKTGIYAPYGLDVANDVVKILTRGIVFGGPSASYQDIVLSLDR